MSKEKLVSDFWLGKNSSEEDYEMDFSKNGAFEGGYNHIIVALASARRAISNFVSILTNKDIPVIFAESGGTGMTDGKKVILSANINKREDFDWGVGLALHEAAHILLTDMSYFISLWKKTPKDLKDLAESKGISSDQISLFFKFIFNYVEDRYIDTYVYDTAPGYRGYYSKLYKKFFHCKEITDALKSNGWRTPTLSSYEMRVVNMTNPHSDPNALPALGDIFSMIDVKNIRRLKTTSDRFDLALKITRKILDQINKDDQKKQNNKTGTDETITKIIGVIGGKVEEEKTSKKPDDIGKHGISDKELKKILQSLDKQRNFLLGKVDKKEIAEDDKKILNVIEEAGIHVVQIQNPLIGNGIPKINCIVVKKLTKSLIDSGVLPMANRSLKCFGNFPTKEMSEAINKGVVLGIMLGRKLMIRREENITRFSRRREGKIDRRILAGIGAGLEDIFYHVKTDKYGKANLHITVDSSSSMESMNKWGPTMTCVVAICKAASMIPNLRVSVSFRATQTDSSGEELPYIILAYDSETDKFEKVRQLFPYLLPRGFTPEGMAMEATIKSFISKTMDGSEYFFLNLSDGEPYFVNNSVNYSGEIAVNHTREVMRKLRKNGFRILSYFISDSHCYRKDDFYKMYGKDSRYIDVTSVFDVARTMNDLFLKKQID